MNGIPPIKRYLAECIGTLVLVVFGCGTAVAVGCDGTATFGSSYLLTALAFGLTAMALSYSIGPVSGCHINPAVSLAMVVNRRLSPLDFFGYVIAQFLGATVGALLLSLIFGTQRGFAANSLYNNDVVASLLIECVLTFMFVLSVLGAVSREEDRSVSGLVIGLSLVLVHVLGISLTGTSVNPARSFGPALLTGGDAMGNVWVFLAGPCVGALLASGVYAFLTQTAARRAGSPAAADGQEGSAGPRRVPAPAAEETSRPRRGFRQKRSAGAQPQPADAQPQVLARPRTEPEPQADAQPQPQAPAQPARQPQPSAGTGRSIPFSPFPYGPGDPFSPFGPFTSRDPFASAEPKKPPVPPARTEDGVSGSDTSDGK